MPLSFTFLDLTKEAPKVAMWQNPTGKRLYLNEDQTRVVMEENEHASYVLCGPNAYIRMEDAVKYGLIQADDVPPVVQAEMPEPVGEPDEAVFDAMDEADAAREEAEMAAKEAAKEEKKSGLVINTDEPEDKEMVLGQGSAPEEDDKVGADAGAKAQDPAQDKAQRPAVRK